MLPAGPTVVDVLANAAFYYGALRMLATRGPAGLDEDELRRRRGTTSRRRPPRHRRRGSTGPASARSPADELVLRHLLPLAHEGLEQWGVSGAVRDRYLGVIEGRCTSGRNGAAWQVGHGRSALEERGRRPARARCSGMLERYAEGMHANEPVHTWKVP